MQSVIETKYLAKQEVFRFKIPPEPAPGSSLYMLNFERMTMLDVEKQIYLRLKRRPHFVSADMVNRIKW